MRVTKSRGCERMYGWSKTFKRSEQIKYLLAGSQVLFILLLILITADLQNVTALSINLLRLENLNPRRA